MYLTHIWLKFSFIDTSSKKGTGLSFLRKLTPTTVTKTRTMTTYARKKRLKAYTSLWLRCAITKTLYSEVEITM